MKKKDLDIRLERVRPFREPSAALEQYPTPATIASDILFTAYANGDVSDMIFLLSDFIIVGFYFRH